MQGDLLPRLDLVHGILERLILNTLCTLCLKHQQNWGVSERIRKFSCGVLQAQHGSLYPAVQWLARQGPYWATSGVPANNRRDKHYELRVAGPTQLKNSSVSWRTLTSALHAILDEA
ncbi:MAG: helix-turn-helix transcriptional regulator [Bryobacterales bacterium]|nr:helix-turn-helix transcriptional regulator [Bryobacterales bacterium]